MQEQPPQYVAQPQPVVQYNSAPGTQVVVTNPAPQQNYTIQNVPASNQDGCCGGLSDKFNGPGGMITGAIQVVIAVLAIILSGVSYAVSSSYLYYSGAGIWSAIIFFLPTGILGIASKQKHTGVIIAYMIMCIFCSLESIGMLAYEGVFAGFNAFTSSCNYACNSYYPYGCYETCYTVGSEGGVAVHSILAILAFVEFVVAIVGAVICCGGLYCCCASRPTTATTTTTTVHYAGQPQVVQQPMQQQYVQQQYVQQQQPTQPYPAKA